MTLVPVLLSVREFDPRLDWASSYPTTRRMNHAGRTHGPLFPDLPRQLIYCNQAEYEDLNDAKRLEQDATFRVNWLEEDS
jgi:hypothetical protein